MPQSPTKTDNSDLFHKFTCLNDIADSVNRPKGAISDERNLIDDQTGDLSRRAGRDFESLGSGAVSIIYQLQWDDGAITSITQSGTAARYDAFVQSTSGDMTGKFANPATPGPMPTFPSYIPFIKAHGNVPDFTSLMRALSEAKQWVSATDFTWRSLAYAFDSYDANGTLIGSNIRTKADALYNQSLGYKLRPTLAYGLLAPPTDGTQMPVDFYYVDYLSDRNYMVTDMNLCITNYNSLKNSFVKTYPLDGATSFVNYTVADDYGVTATFATLQGTWNTLANLINNNLLRWKSPLGGITGDNNTVKTIRTTLAANFATSAACILSKLGQTAPIFQNYDAACVILSGLAGNVGGVFAYDSDNLGRDIRAYSTILTFSGTSKANSTIDFYVNFGCSLSGTRTIILPSFLGGSTISQSFRKVDTVTTAAYVFPASTIDDLRTYVSNYVSTGTRNIGWEALDCIFISNRIQAFFASGTTPYITFPIVTPDELFIQLTNGTATTSETDILWGQSKLGSAGGASRSYPSGTVLGVPQPYTPSQYINFDASAPGFNRARFLGPYRPTVLMSVAVGGSILTGSPTTLTVRVYINTTLVRTIVYPVNGGTSYHAFSIKDLGDFTSIRPPDNDPNNGLDGWPPPPSVRVTAQVDTGTVTLNDFTKLRDIVVNYPV